MNTVLSIELCVLMELTLVSSDSTNLLSHPRVRQSSAPTIHSELATRIEHSVRYWLNHALCWQLVTTADNTLYGGVEGRDTWPSFRTCNNPQSWTLNPSCVPVRHFCQHSDKCTHTNRLANVRDSETLHLGLRRVHFRFWWFPGSASSSLWNRQCLRKE
jgi:hypothetical protein